MDLSHLSHSYPFLHLSQKFGVDYGDVLKLVEAIDHPDPNFYEGSFFVSVLSIEETRIIEKVCRAPWRWQFPPQGRGI